MADETLIEGRGKVKRRIHVFVIIILSLIIGGVVFLTSSQKEKQKKEEGKAVEVVHADAPSGDQMAALLQKQKETEVPGLPGAAMEGVGKTPEESKDLEEKDSLAIEEAKERARISISGLIVEKGDNGVQGLGQLPVPPQQAIGGEFLNNYVRNSTPPDPLLPVRADMPQQQKQELSKQEQDAEWMQQQTGKGRQNPIKEDPPNSKFTIFQGSVIPSVMESRIESTFPGEIRARVIADIYDGVTGSYLMIPKGSMLYGSYSNNIIQGQERVMAAFHRIVYPGGRSVSLEGMQSVDGQGTHGVAGEVDNHYIARFGSSLLVAVLGAIADQNASGGNTVINTGGGSSPGSSAGQILVDISKENQERIRQIQPSITIKQGEKFNVLVNRDMDLKPY